MSDKTKTSMPATVKNILPSFDPNEPDKAEIHVRDAEPLYQELRVPNSFRDEEGREVELKKGAEVEVHIEADKDAKILTTANSYFHEWEICSTNVQYAKDHAAELVAFLKGLDAAGKWIPSNVDEASQIAAKSLRMDDVDLAKRMIEKIDWNISYTKKFRSDMDRLGQFVNLKIDWKTMFDPRYLAKLGPSYVEA